ncbi:hypothetical protein [Pseudogemmobacter bohemicus]|uniref:hypothetical protein n=1 Tax=Pseudogemmobacter bohemicus TaxID=2250708 RepID=UPI0013005D58|nr:hypothetical protein [Pseudogemmobacter bohemicus]
MKKADCESAVRSLCHDWLRDTGQDSSAPGFHPSVYAFMNWMRDNGYGGYLTFRSRMGAAYDVEMWFDDEFKQNWRR